MCRCVQLVKHCVSVFLILFHCVISCTALQIIYVDKTIVLEIVQVVDTYVHIYIPVGNKTLVINSGPWPHLLLAVTVIV